MNRDKKQKKKETKKLAVSAFLIFTNESEQVNKNNIQKLYWIQRSTFDDSRHLVLY